MGGGCVLDFSNRTFREFVLDSTGKDIYAPTYDYDSGSKANRLRAFWTEEPNHVVGRLVADLLSYRQETALDQDERQLHQDCDRIASRLQESAPVAESAALTPNTAERNFEVLARTVREAIEKNEPEAGLDRLHTFVVKYLRVICAAKGIGGLGAGHGFRLLELFALPPPGFDLGHLGVCGTSSLPFS